MTARKGEPRRPPLRWVSQQERAWDDQAVWRACIDLLEREPLDSLSPEQRIAHLAYHADCTIARDGLATFVAAAPPRRVEETAAALERIGATAHASALRARPSELATPWTQLTPSIESRLRLYLDAFEPYFVGVARPNCTS